MCSGVAGAAAVADASADTHPGSTRAAAGADTATAAGADTATAAGADTAAAAAAPAAAVHAVREAAEEAEEVDRVPLWGHVRGSAGVEGAGADDLGESAGRRGQAGPRVYPLPQVHLGAHQDESNSTHSSGAGSHEVG